MVALALNRNMAFLFEVSRVTKERNEPWEECCTMGFGYYMGGFLGPYYFGFWSFSLKLRRRKMDGCFLSIIFKSRKETRPDSRERITSEMDILNLIHSACRRLILICRGTLKTWHV